MVQMSRASTPAPKQIGQLPEDQLPQEPPPNPFATAMSSAWSGTLSEEQAATAAAARKHQDTSPAVASPFSVVPLPPLVAQQHTQRRRQHMPQLLSVEAAAAQVAAARRVSFESRRASFTPPGLRGFSAPLPPPPPPAANEPGSKLSSACGQSKLVEGPAAHPATNGASGPACRQRGEDSGKGFSTPADPYDAYAIFADGPTASDDVYQIFA